MSEPKNPLGMPVFVDECGRLAVECNLCDSIHVDIVEHLRVDHASNPVAQRIVREIELMEKESREQQ